MNTFHHACACAMALALLTVGCSDGHLGGVKKTMEPSGDDDKNGDGDVKSEDKNGHDMSNEADGGEPPPDERDASEPVDVDPPEDKLPFCQFASKATVPQADIDAHLAARKTVRDGYARWKAGDHAHYTYRRSFGGNAWHDIEVRDDVVVRVEDVYFLQDAAPKPTVVEGKDLLTYDWSPHPKPTILDPLFEECLERLCIDTIVNHPYLAAEVDEFGAIRTCRTGAQGWSLDLYVTKL